MEEFAEAEHTIVNHEVGIRGSLVEEFETLNASMDFDGAVSVSGEIEIEETAIEDIVIVPLIYNEEGQYVGSFRIHETNDQQTVAFSGGSVGFRTPVDRPLPDDFELIVAEPLL